MHEHRDRIVVIGAGRVGATFAYSCVVDGLGSEIVLVDKDRRRAEGEAMDIRHSVPFARASSVRVGGLADCADAAVTVFAAGVSQRPGESRLDLARRNAAIFEEVLDELRAHDPPGVLIVASNPVDVLTQIASKRFASSSRVLGSGTVLDSARFRVLLAAHYAVDPESVNACVLGEHGDSEVAAWSLSRVAGVPVDEFCRARGMAHDPDEMHRLFEQTRDAAYAIIERKGATHFAIAAALVRITRAVLRDERTVLTVSAPTAGRYGLPDLCLSLPCIVGGIGVEAALEIPLTEAESAALHRSARTIQATLESVANGA